MTAHGKGRQYYFVVYYDIDEGTWSTDPAREDAVWGSDQVWNEASGEWERGEFSNDFAPGTLISNALAELLDDAPMVEGA